MTLLEGFRGDAIVRKKATRVAFLRLEIRTRDFYSVARLKS